MIPINCPVCGKGGLPPTAHECPQCNADLEVFQLLEALQEIPLVSHEVQIEPDAARVEEETVVITTQAPQLAPHPLRMALLPAALIFISLLLGISGVYLALRYDVIASRVMVEPGLPELYQQLTATMARFDERLAHITAQVPALNERLALLEQSLKPGSPAVTTEQLTVTRRLMSGDTIWEIAKRYYGVGKFYPVILALNPGLGIHLIPGGTIRLPLNRVAAYQLLTALTLKQNDRRLLHYPVVMDDTWQKISQRLYGHGKATTKLRQLNGDNLPPVDATILIPFGN